MSAISSPRLPGAAADVSEGLRRPWSLRRRLMWLAAIATAAAWLTGGTAVLIAAHQESENLYDQRLRDVAGVILSFAGHELGEIQADGRTEPVHEETAATLDPRYAYQIWSRDGRLLLMSHNAPRQPFAPLTHVGLLDNEINGRPHCVYALHSADGGMVIQVAEDESRRDAFMLSVNVWLALFLVLSSVCLLAFNRWMFSRATRALDQSAQQLVDRSVDDLRPIRPDDPPSELVPFLRSINALFGRFERTLDSERHFTAAAAHELRTPLAAVRIQAQVAERARSQREAREALRVLGLCVERASRMIDQLLTLARVETLAPDSATVARLRLDEVVEQVVRDLSHLLQAADVRLELDLQPASIQGIEFGVSALVRNLIDNAARHAPRGGAVAVSIAARDGRVLLAVEDSGPGIPDAERARVFERFYRLAGTDSEGCGVGLSIVRCVAEVHRARIELSTGRLGGLRVEVSFLPA
jgi:signal transduction histidine kinase